MLATLYERRRHGALLTTGSRRLRLRALRAPPGCCRRGSPRGRGPRRQRLASSRAPGSTRTASRTRCISRRPSSLSRIRAGATPNNLLPSRRTSLLHHQDLFSGTIQAEMTMSFCSLDIGARSSIGASAWTLGTRRVAKCARFSTVSAEAGSTFGVDMSGGRRRYVGLASTTRPTASAALQCQWLQCQWEKTQQLAMTCEKVISTS